MPAVNLPPDWPRPDEAALAHSARLGAVVAGEIEASGGVIPFERFMALALHTPGLGYYSAGARKFGVGGDFVTAPEISPLFGRCLARQLAPVLAITGSELLELGAGSGALAVQILAELEALGIAPGRYRILEPSADLAERQRAALAGHDSGWRVQWLERLPEEPFAGIVLGNEVVDALPVTRFRITVDGAEGEGVGLRDGKLVPAPCPLHPEVAALLGVLAAEYGIELPVGYRSEQVPGLDAWVAGVTAPLARGLVVLIDYGYPRREYYLPERNDGTLLCHYRHRAHHDPLLMPGLQDITASVDFTALAEAGLAAGLEIAGYAPQGAFLLHGGLLDLLDADRAGSAGYLLQVQQVKRLTLPGEMGDRFQVLAMSRNLDRVPAGFRGVDWRDRL